MSKHLYTFVDDILYNCRILTGVYYMPDNSNNHQDEISNLKGYIFFFSGQLISLFGSSIIQLLKKT